jgi:hypothetical protein
VIEFVCALKKEGNKKKSPMPTFPCCELHSSHYCCSVGREGDQKLAKKKGEGRNESTNMPFIS